MCVCVCVCVCEGEVDKRVSGGVGEFERRQQERGAMGAGCRVCGVGSMV